MSKEFKRTEHSDIIIHWTGKDIDTKDPEFSKTLPVHWRKHCLRPIQQPSLIKEPELIGAYVERLRDILKYGLWMTGEKSREEIFNDTKNNGYSRNDGRVFDNHEVSRISFTELKLSEARQHAYEYGRLGIGVKRMFLYNRAGQPLVYAGPMQKKSADKYQGDSYTTKPQKPNWFYYCLGSSDCNLQSLLKYTGEMEDNLNYKYYSESEWRIIYSGALKKMSSLAKFDGIVEGKNFDNQFIDINDPDNEHKKYNNKIELNDFKLYLDKNKDAIQKNKLSYLLPLDYWLGVIIYPCPVVKIVAEQDDEIRQLIFQTRCKRLEQYKNLLHQEDTKKQGKLETLANCVGGKYMMPMEIDLDTTSHF